MMIAVTGYICFRQRREDDIMSQNYTEEVKDRLLHELTDAPQGINDSDMPMPGNPNPTGEVGPSPSADSIPESLAALEGGLGLDETGEEEDPGDADAGGVNVSNTGA
jgi:hypothetical protein